MGDFNKVGSRSFLYRLITRVSLAALVSVVIGGGLALLNYYLAFLNLFGSVFITPTYIVGITIACLALLSLVSFIISLIEYRNLGYKIEENSLYLREGFFSVDMETIPFFKIINISFYQSALQRVFGVGQLILDQDDGQSNWDSIDSNTANQIIEVVSHKGNIQPVKGVKQEALEEG